jgi:hypothetical protein
MFPSEAFLNILLENAILRGDLTARKAREEECIAKFRTKTQQHFPHVLGNAILATEIGGHDSMQLSKNGTLTMTPFVTYFLKAFGIDPVYETKFIEQLYQELRPIALHENKVRGRKFVLAFHGGCMMAICPHALTDDTTLRLAAA